MFGISYIPTYIDRDSYGITKLCHVNHFLPYIIAKDVNGKLNMLRKEFFDLYLSCSLA